MEYLAWLLLGLTFDLYEPYCPSNMVEIPGHHACIDRYEYPNEEGVLPWVGMSALPIYADSVSDTYNAVYLCESWGKRVCTRDEWIAACEGPDRSKFPWGSELPDPRHLTPETAPCNYLKPYLGPDEQKVAERDSREMRRLWQGEASGSRSTCKSASGAMDMVGNVEEWVRCPGYGSKKWCLMGRFWSDPVSCSSTIAGHDPKWQFYETGTRCCLDLP